MASSPLPDVRERANAGVTDLRLQDLWDPVVGAAGVVVALDSRVPTSVVVGLPKERGN
jgi:hypothetical protein